MTNSIALPCDGCSQIASAEHLVRRLQRLEWTTRYRPVHINTLLLSAFSPVEEKDFLYFPGGEFHGEAALLLEALGMPTTGRGADSVQAEFQRAGFFLTHVLECPLEKESKRESESPTVIAQRLPAVAVRIRRSLKPRRVVLISQALAPVLEEIQTSKLGCPVVLDLGKPFRFDGPAPEHAVARLREALAAAAAD